MTLTLTFGPRHWLIGVGLTAQQPAVDFMRRRASLVRGPGIVRAQVGRPYLVLSWNEPSSEPAAQ